jgi:hypothetical protein
MEQQGSGQVGGGAKSSSQQTIYSSWPTEGSRPTFDYFCKLPNFNIFVQIVNEVFKYYILECRGVCEEIVGRIVKSVAKYAAQRYHPHTLYCYKYSYYQSFRINSAMLQGQGPVETTQRRGLCSGRRGVWKEVSDAQTPVSLTQPKALSRAYSHQCARIYPPGASRPGSSRSDPWRGESQKVQLVGCVRGRKAG